MISPSHPFRGVSDSEAMAQSGNGAPNSLNRSCLNSTSGDQGPTEPLQMLIIDPKFKKLLPEFEWRKPIAAVQTGIVVFKWFLESKQWHFWIISCFYFIVDALSVPEPMPVI